MQLAVGTSLAVIVFTSVSSALAHHRRGAVRWPLVVQLSLGFAVGGWLGGVLAVWLGGVTAGAGVRPVRAGSGGTDDAWSFAAGWALAARCFE